MSFLSKLFGGSETVTSQVPSEPLNFDIPKDWFLGEDDLKALVDASASVPSVRLTQSKDAMDDTSLLSLSIFASEFECVDLDLVPSFNFRARKNGLTVTIDSFAFFKDKFFSSRGKHPTVRLRFDGGEPQVCQEDEVEYGTTKASLHFDKSGVFHNSIFKNQMLLQILPERGHNLLAKFDFGLAKPFIEGFATAVFGPEYLSIATINPQITDMILRMGPKYTLGQKKALAARGFNPGPIDYSKGFAFFDAAQKFAVARDCYEIVGPIYGGVARTSWGSTLYSEASSRLKEEMGPLKIFD